MLTTSVTEAADLLKQGKVLAYPTEAVWGLGCDPYNETAFAEILRLKQRPVEKGVILLAASISQVEHLFVGLTEETQQKIIHSWSHTPASDRATTWLLPANESIPTWIKGKHPLVAVRVTSHPLCIALCHAFNGFIVSTSANPAGLAAARTMQDAYQYFQHENGLNYLNGDLGLSQQPSRIINALTGEIIRD